MAFLSAVELERLALSLPRHVAKVSRLMDNFEKRTGKHTAVVDGTRTETRQAEIFADSVKAGGYKGGQGYRAAPPTKSKHTRGAATDLNIIGETSGDAATDARNRYYVILAEEAEKVGLHAGLNFKSGLPDPYHVEEPETLAQLDAEYAAFLRGRLWRTAITVIAVALIAWWWLNRRRQGNAG